MNSKKKLLASTIAFFMGSAVQGVVAQEEVGGQEENSWALEEIVVTAQKREERLIDVPISIATISGETISDAGIKNIDDLSYAVPNLSFLDTSPTREVSIRGVSNGLGTSALVGMYINELPVSSVPVVSVDLQMVDLERVEVLKGPQGTLYGQGSVGGTIRVITKSPEFNKFEGQLGGSVYSTDGDDWSEGLTSIVNIPVIEDKLAFRASTVYKNSSGWIDQPARGKKNVNDSELSYVRLNGLWQISEDLSVDLMAVGYHNNAGATNIINTKPVTDMIYKVPIINGVFPSTSYTSDYDLYNLTVNREFDFATLTASSSYFDVQNEESSSSLFIEQVSGDVLNLNGLETRNTASGFTQEVRLTGSYERLEWTAGGFYNNNDREYSSNLVYLFGAITIADLDVFQKYSSESAAIFANLSYPISDSLTLAVGTRYFNDEQTFKVNNIDFVSEDFENISSKLSLSFALNENSNIYVSATEGFRSGGLNDPIATGSTTPIPYDPESILSYEVGIKTSVFDSRLSMEAAVYHSVYSDYQSFLFIGAGQIRNAGEAKIQGVEWAALWRVSSNIVLGFNGHVTESEFTELNDLTIVVKEGDPLDFVPKYSYSVTADFDFTWFHSIPGFARLDINKQGPKNSTLRNLGYATETNESRSIGIVNAQLGGKFENIEMKLFGRNLTNEKRATTEPISNALTQLRPRTIGIELDYIF